MSQCSARKTISGCVCVRVRMCAWGIYLICRRCQWCVFSEGDVCVSVGDVCVSVGDLCVSGSDVC